MDKDDIILMADASGLSFYGMGRDRDKFLHYLEAFADLVAAAEREACAKVCDEMEEKAEEHGTECCKWPTPNDCAYAVRAGGNT